MAELSRLKFRCRRGMKELDVILARYLVLHLATASATERQQFEVLLDLQDPILYGMILGTETVPEPYQALIQKLTQF